jgi:hypothetical protein
MLAGEPPFAGGDIQSKLQRHATEPIKSMESVGVPPQLAHVVAYSMAKNPAVRFQRASILADQLAPFVGTSQQRIKPASPLPTQAAFEMGLQQKQATAATTRARPAPAAAASVGIAPAVVTGPAAAPAAPVTLATKSSTVSAAAKRRAKAKKRNNLIFLTFSILAVCGAVAAVLFVFNSHATSIGKEQTNGPQKNGPTFTPPGSGPPAPPETPRSTPSQPGTTVASPTAGPATTNLVQDDGQFWSRDHRRWSVIRKGSGF